ncbi:UDP-glycosyltransferase 73C1-like [Elaeis guineensis]|uniref:Glycosyltransferase n=1 Tax=Elaeis guineensis var. tenera TaxID=51953 RepID=A0A6I9RCE6_ELAGV|nr:UDP-glycosyltransferase 73C1-like [Elaeis guineensis]
MNGLGDPKLHFVFVPFLAQGHMLPMIDLAHLLAKRGVLATVITTPFNASRIKNTIDRAGEAGLPIRFVPLRFPCAEAGLPEGCENVDVIPSANLAKNFFAATSLLGPPLETYLREQQQPYPSCIVSDFCNPWTREVASRLGVPLFTCHPVCCFYLLGVHNILHSSIHDAIADETEPFVVPGLAHKIEVTKAQTPGIFPGNEWEEIREEIRAADREADGILVNSFSELEPWYVEGYREVVGKKVWALGPLSLCNKDAADMAARGKKASIDKDRCLRWLDSMKPRSVVYVSFGSITYVPPSQIIEVGAGLEASNHPFIWVIKEIEISPEVERWLSGRFERRTSARGLIIKGWAPQLMILSHPAVGGFITHCGWNSSLEAISAGVPMITWPFFADQFLNERLIVDVLRTGITAGVKNPWNWGTVSDGVYVKRDDVEKAVRSLMDIGEERERRRERATELGEKARKAVEEGGSSYVNVTLLIEFVRNKLLHSCNALGSYQR